MGRRRVRTFTVSPYIDGPFLEGPHYTLCWRASIWREAAAKRGRSAIYEDVTNASMERLAVVAKRMGSIRPVYDGRGWVFERADRGRSAHRSARQEHRRFA